MQVQIFSVRSWFAWIAATAFYAFQYVLRVSPGIMMEDIRLKFEVDASQFGIFSGAYYLGYAIVHLPIGILLDRIGPRVIISSSILLAVLGIMPLIYSNNWIMAVIGRFLLGAGSSTAILGVFKVIRMNFPAHKFATILGISVTLGVLGAIYGGRPIHNYIANHGWLTVLNGLSCVGVGLAVVVFFTVPNYKIVEKKHKGNIFQDLKYAFSTRFVVATSVLGALMIGPLEGFADVWGTSFLVHSYQLDQATASLLPSLIFLGMCVGSPLLAYLGEKTNKFQEIINICALGMAILFCLLLVLKLELLLLNLVFLAIGVMCAYQVLVIHLNSLRVSAEHAGVVTAFTNMVIMSFGYIFHFGIGKLMTLFWEGHCINGIASYSSITFTKGLSIIPIALLIAYAGFKIMDRHPQIKKIGN